MDGQELTTWSFMIRLPNAQGIMVLNEVSGEDKHIVKETCEEIGRSGAYFIEDDEMIAFIPPQAVMGVIAQPKVEGEDEAETRIILPSAFRQSLIT